MLIIIIFLIMIALGVPVGFSMVLTAMTYILSANSVSLTFVPQAMVSGVSSYTMLAIPFFMIVGELMNSSGITKRIFRFANCCVGHITGGLGHVNVLSSMLFAGMSGAAVADCAGLGAIEIEAMKNEGFDADFSVGITAVSSIIGPIIPPSSPMVLFGIAASISIGSLFMGGISVGIIMGLFMMITVYLTAKNRNYPKHKRAKFKELFDAFLSAVPALLSPIILVGGILSGFFTPTEAAAVAVFYSLIVGIFIYKELKIKDILRVLVNGIENLGLVMLLMASGKIFAWVLGMEKITELATSLLFGITDSNVIILVLINILLIFMGTFMETNASILILTPILMPIVNQIGMHPIQFGVIMVFALMIGLLTPPMAITLFLTSKLGGISFQRAFKAVKPYYIGLIIVLILINIFPQITLTIPKLLLGKSF
ncbi:TRAP transporter large permease subunit [Iocasia frigidifontis]|uniref:TRAP transporter large permease subunit n=1 Tax=Iocasia fonsfrigidae TaxID=2682810 RepID=A0A8A7KD99_9FIRM|nr:TRAP transporter large permease [Iocasia fonsfrigidae]MTI59396.1 TRAP transporter large permease [Bacillota bacterium]QTL99756.1 TRAP transporter large permease subunit [Iocasia fonsfrigidae]